MENTPKGVSLIHPAAVFLKGTRHSEVEDACFLPSNEWKEQCEGIQTKDLVSGVTVTMDAWGGSW